VWQVDVNRLKGWKRIVHWCDPPTLPSYESGAVFLNSDIVECGSHPSRSGKFTIGWTEACQVLSPQYVEQPS
jgi:hypothetical protein